MKNKIYQGNNLHNVHILMSNYLLLFKNIISTKFTIQKAIKQVFHVYPNFKTEILAFKQNGIQKRFIELKAILELQIRGKMCKIDYNMMIPSGFPNKAPYVRIINRNPDFKVDDFYVTLRSPTDQNSYILNERLNSVKNWDAYKTIVNIIIESHDLFRNKFPFYKPNVQQQNQGWGSNSPWQQLSNNNNNVGFNSNMNQGFGQNYGGFNNQGFNQGYNNVGMGYGGGYNANQMQMNNIPSNMKQPPIPFNANNLTQTIANGQKYVGQTRKILQDIKKQHIKSIDTVQNLDVLNYSLQSQQKFLTRQNGEMNSLIQENKYRNDDIESLVKLIKPKDDLSMQIVDLIASIKARQQCTAEMEKKFKDEEIILEDFLKLVRRNQDVKFQEKILLAKCVGISRNYKY